MGFFRLCSWAARGLARAWPGPRFLLGCQARPLPDSGCPGGLGPLHEDPGTHCVPQALRSLVQTPRAFFLGSFLFPGLLLLTNDRKLSASDGADLSRGLEARVLKSRWGAGSSWVVLDRVCFLSSSFGEASLSSEPPLQLQGVWLPPLFLTLTSLLRGPC